MSSLLRLLLSLSLLLIVLASPPQSPYDIETETTPEPSYRRDVDCSSDYVSGVSADAAGGGYAFVPGCHPTTCSRLVFDDFLDADGVERLRSMASRAIARGRGGDGRPGPTIVDVNSGFLRDDQGLAMLYTDGKGDGSSPLFSPEEYGFYGSVVERIKRTVGAANGLDPGFPVFTAPTFITRIKYDEGWRPKSMHDIYWMPHVDKVRERERGRGEEAFSRLCPAATARVILCVEEPRPPSPILDCPFC